MIKPIQEGRACVVNWQTISEFESHRVPHNAGLVQRLVNNYQVVCVFFFPLSHIVDSSFSNSKFSRKRIIFIKSLIDYHLLVRLPYHKLYKFRIFEFVLNDNFDTVELE